MELADIKLKKDTRQREKQRVVDKIISFLEENVDENIIEIFKNWGSGLGRSGRPDIEIVYNGTTWYIEAKDPKGKLSNIQKKRIKKFKDAGVKVYVIDDKDVFIKEVWPIMNK